MLADLLGWFSFVCKMKLLVNLFFKQALLLATFGCCMGQLLAQSKDSLAATAYKHDTLFVSTPDTTIIDNNTIWHLVKVDKVPNFPGGEKAWSKYIRETLDLDLAYRAMDVEVSFVVEVNGKISQVNFLDPTAVPPNIKENIIQLFTKGPAWQAAEYQQRKVRFNAYQQFNYNR
jgi:hypothetical protein